MLTAIPLTERKSKILHNFIKKSKLKLLYLQQTLKQKYIAISYKGRYTEQKERIIFQRGLLDWLLPIWTLPSVSEIGDKMQVVYEKHITLHTYIMLLIFFKLLKMIITVLIMKLMIIQLCINVMIIINYQILIKIIISI